MCDINYIFNVIKSGVSEIISEHELYDLIKKKDKLVIKVGFDPTTCDLHLGHVVILKKLRQFQDFGYNICFLIGDFTAMIGDPSGRGESRNQLDKNRIINNYKTYSEQIFKILKPDLTKIYFNSSWFNFFGIENFINLLSFTTVSRLLERSDFKSRYVSGKSIFIHEFIYPLLQSYDSVFIESDIEIGGIDQKFNLLLARDIQKRFKQKSQVLIMMPILNGLDGKNKMSKSLFNCVNINDNFYDIFCKIMSIPDFLMKEYFIFLGFLSMEEYDNFFNSQNNPMLVKIKLAFNIVSLIYDKHLAIQAQERFFRFFSKKKILDNDVELVSLNIINDELLLSHALYKINLVLSNSDFKRLLKCGAIKINSNVIKNRNFILKSNIVYFMQVGKKKFIKLFLKKS